jgi:VCBS repeat-containing protein
MSAIRPSVYNKSAHFSVKVNGTYMYAVSNAVYDFVQLSMDEGYITEFRIAVTDQP